MTREEPMTLMEFWERRDDKLLRIPAVREQLSRELFDEFTDLRELQDRLTDPVTGKRPWLEDLAKEGF